MRGHEPQLLQLRFRDEPWKMLVCCLLLNRTQRKQVDRVVDALFADYPDAATMARARPDHLRELVRPLGFSQPRVDRLIGLANAWEATGCTTPSSSRPSVNEVSVLPGVGEYATDAYRLLVLGDLTVDPKDKELKKWREWRRG